MASLTRCLRPIASRFTARPFSQAVSYRTAIPSATRMFSVYGRSQVKKYTKDHEWIDLSPDNKTGTIGISDYAAHALGDVVYVELPAIALEVAAGDSIGAVESVKSASDINSPISCTVTERTRALVGGWIAKVKVGETALKEVEDLMDLEAYAEFTGEQST